MVVTSDGRQIPDVSRFIMRTILGCRMIGVVVIMEIVSVMTDTLHKLDMTRVGTEYGLILGDHAGADHRISFRKQRIDMVIGRDFHQRV